MRLVDLVGILAYKSHPPSYSNKQYQSFIYPDHCFISSVTGQSKQTLQHQMVSWSQMVLLPCRHVAVIPLDHGIGPWNWIMGELWPGNVCDAWGVFQSRPLSSSASCSIIVERVRAWDVIGSVI